VLVANLAQREDGLWAALDGRALYHEARAAGHVHEGDLSTSVGHTEFVGGRPEQAQATPSTDGESTETDDIPF